MEVIELFGMTTVDRPGLASVEEGGEYHCMVDFQLGGKAESSLLLDILSKSPKAVLAMAILSFTFVPMFTTRESVLPRYVKSLTAWRSCPFTVVIGQF